MSTPIDVFIPLHEKDLSVLPACIASLRRHLDPPPARVLVIPRSDDPGLLRAVAALGVETLPESAFDELTPRSALPEIVVKTKNRTGWYYQQFLKWGARRFARTPNYLVIDADTVLIAPLLVVRDGKPVFDQMAQYHIPYFDTYEKLFGVRPARRPSFIINYMIFSVDMLDELIGEIHARFPGRPWDQTIMAMIDMTEMSSFSEFETYGYWLSEHRPGQFHRGDGRNLELRVRKRHWHWWYRWRALKQSINSISYHNHRR